MKRYKRSLMILLAIVLAFPVAVTGQSYTENRTITRSYKVHPNTTLDISNKYGKVHLINWDRDSVMIEMNLMIKTSSRKKLDKVLENIDFEFTGTDYYIIAKTEFGSKYYNFFDEIKNITGAIFPSDEQVVIDYLVKLPEKINLKVDNRYGDIYADNLNGDITLVLSNGDMKIHRVNGKVSLSLTMADATIHEMTSGNLTINYSELQIRNFGKLNIDSRISKLNLEQGQEIKLNSRRDKLYINKLDKLFGESYFSDIWIYEFLKEANFKLKYGNLNLENIHPAFSFINLDAEYADLNLFFQKSAAYLIDITHKETPLSLPPGISTLEEKMMDAEEKVILTDGYVNQKNATARVKIATVKGSVNIIHK